MPSNQSANNVVVAFKAQSGLGSAATGSGATGLRVTPSQGLKLSIATIPSKEVRRDGQSTRGRHGSRKADAVYSAELSVGTFDELIQAVTRGTWTAATDITQTAMTSITTTTSTIVAAGGSWLTQGVRKGDMVKLAGHSTAANNGKWLRVVDVSATTITLPSGSLTLDAAADTTFTLTIAKTVIMGATPTERYFTLEEDWQDIDGSMYGTDMKVCKLDFNAQPDANIEVTWTFMGLNAIPESSASAPMFTTPTFTTTLPLVMTDGTIRIGGVDYSSITGFQFSVDLGGTVPSVVGSTTGPDVFLKNATVSGSFTGIRQDLTFLTAFSNETQVDFFLHCAENESDPKDFISVYIGNATLSGVDTSIGSDGPMVATIPWNAGKDEAGGASASTMVKFATSAA